MRYSKYIAGGWGGGAGRGGVRVGVRVGVGGEGGDTE